VAAGAARSVAGAHADEQPGRDQCAVLRIDLRRGQGPEHHEDERRADQAQHECSPPSDVALGRLQQPADNAADARDAPVQQREHRDGDADEHAAAQRRPRRERIPIDGHHFSLGQ